MYIKIKKCVALVAMAFNQKISLVPKPRTSVCSVVRHALLLLVFTTGRVSAGFLDFPDITETPSLERESMLRDIDIPSVRERNPDPNAGPRLAVSQFRLQGIVEYPQLGITRAELSKTIEDLRFDLMEEGKLLDSGFTEDELGEVSNLLVEIEKETVDRHVSPLEVQKLVWLVREQRGRRGITLGVIETVADTITKYYRERGFILAKAYIPEQQVRDGVVTLTLLLGVLGEVEVNNNELYSDKSLSSVFDDSFTLPVKNTVVEEKLYLINEFPGVAVHGFFEPGAQVGDTRLNINVLSESEFDTTLRLDNHGSDQTGEYRFYGEAQWNNPLGNADQLHLGLLYSVRPSNTFFGLVRYSTSFFSPRFKLAVGTSNNDFVLGPGNSESINNLKLQGETRQADITATYIIKRSRIENYSVDLVSERIKSILRLGVLPSEGDVGLDDEVRNTSLVFNYDVLQEESKRLHQGDIKLTSGKFLLGAEVGQEPEYNILLTNYTFLTFWQLPYTETTTRLLVHASLQYAGTPLSSISQFSLAGPSRVKSFAVNQFSADDAVYLGVEWIFNSPDWFDLSIGSSNLKDMLQPYVFADYAYGTALALDSTDPNVQAAPDSRGRLSDLGFGVQISYLNDLKGNLLFAFPLRSGFSSDSITDDSDGFKLIFDLQYSFK